jgi:hypothetical protein
MRDGERENKNLEHVESFLPALKQVRTVMPV